MDELRFLPLAAGGSGRVEPGTTLGMAAIACYCTACALWLGSDMVSIPPPLTETVAFYVGLHLALGLLATQPWAACACVVPVLLPVVVPGLVPTEPDVPGWAALLSMIALLLAPAGVGLVLAGCAARRRLLVQGESPST